MRFVSSLVSRVRESVWAPVVAKAAGVVLALVVLGFIGSGALDGLVTPPQAMAAGRFASASSPGTSRSTAATSAPASSATASAPVDSAAPPVAALTPDGKVVLNVAGVDELVKIPGIGKKKAAAILAMRERLGGRFKSLNELTRVRGIKRKFLERIKPHVVLDAPPETPPQP